MEVLTIEVHLLMQQLVAGRREGCTPHKQLELCSSAHWAGLTHAPRGSCARDSSHIT